MYQTQIDKDTNKQYAVQRLSDGAYIPFDPDNTDFVEYQKWLSEGNTPLPAENT